MAIIEANIENWEDLIHTDYALVEFTGDFCGVCRVLEPFYTEASNRFFTLPFLQVNADHETALAERYDIKALPTVLFLQNGKEMFREIGICSREEIDAALKKLLYQL